MPGLLRLRASFELGVSVFPAIMRNLTVQVLLAAGLGVGLALALGDGAGQFGALAGLVKVVFLDALRMLIAPLIFFSLIGGIAAIGNVVRLKTLGAATMAYYLGTTGIAAVLGLIGVFLIHPWTAYPPHAAPVETSLALIDPSSGSLLAILQGLLRSAFTNPFSALADLNVLGIVANAFLIGIAIAVVLPPDNLLTRAVDEINKVLARVLGWIILLLPVGIFAILFDFTQRMALGDSHPGHLLAQLGSFAALVVALTLIHGTLVLPALARFLGGVGIAEFIRGIARPMLVALSTSSSLATLPVTMRAAEDNLQIDPSVTSFVLPLGATMNMDGTALFEAVGAVFLAYLFGIDLSAVTIFIIFLMAMVASIGAPGMPSASMAGMQMVLLAVGIPLEGIAILLIVERPLDTIRTALNVEGDMTGAAIVTRIMGIRRKPVPA